MNISRFFKLPRKNMVSLRDCVMVIIGVVVALAGTGTAALIERRHKPLAPETSGVTIKWLPSSVRQWDKHINEMAKKYNVDPNFIAIIITMESGGYAKAQSEAGAEGLMQVTAPTAKDIAAKFLKEPRTSYNLQDPRTNIEFGAAYLAYLRDEFGTHGQGPDWLRTVELVATGYNGGPGTANALEKGEGLRDTQPVVYARDAFNMWRERNAATSPTYERWLERSGSELVDKAKDENKYDPGII